MQAISISMIIIEPTIIKNPELTESSTVDWLTQPEQSEPSDDERAVQQLRELRRGSW
jgi:hypothetical protein